MEGVDARQLCQDILRYLKGDDVDFFQYSLDLSHLTEFERDVLQQTRRIPYGQTITYSELAGRVGRPAATRAVGQALAKNPYPIVIPCHRVVARSGPGGYMGGVELKTRLLELERSAEPTMIPADGRSRSVLTSSTSAAVAKVKARREPIPENSIAIEFMDAE